MIKQEDVSVLVELPVGLVRGAVCNDVAAFYGLPYGQRLDPVDRLSQVGPHAPWAGERDARSPGPVFPQTRSRLASLMGDAICVNSQCEDAFNLSVWAPQGRRNLPVFIFIHGGAFMSGGGSAPWYDGERLARECGMVVVTVNYRLGALGHFIEGNDRDRGGEASDGARNRPVRDLLRALQWVKENIEAFGGNPEAVTVGGQSAGAWYAWLLGVTPAARGLFQRNVLLSLPVVPPQSAADAYATSAALMAQAAGRPFSDLSVVEVLTAQSSLARTPAGFADFSPPFRPMAEETVVPEWLFNPANPAFAVHVDATLFVFAAEETSAFLFKDPSIVNADEGIVRDWYGARFGANSAAAWNVFAMRRQLRAVDSVVTPYTQLVDAGTYLSFERGVAALAPALSMRGTRAYACRFAVPSRIPHLMTPHCMELPFLFGNREQWSDAPMLARVSPTVFDRVGETLRTALQRFVSYGEIAETNGESLPGWTPYCTQKPIITEINAEGATANYWHLPFA